LDREHRENREVHAQVKVPLPRQRWQMFQQLVANRLRRKDPRHVNVKQGIARTTADGGR
jgi:hypothetical protein